MRYSLGMQRLVNLGPVSFTMNVISISSWLIVGEFETR